MSQRSDLTPLRVAWLLLAVLGGILGLRDWPQDPDPSEWVALVTLALWCLAETSIRRNWLALLTLPAMVLGVGCALPLYLFFRSRRIA